MHYGCTNHRGRLLLTASTSDSTVSTPPTSTPTHKYGFNLGMPLQKSQQILTSLPPVVLVVSFSPYSPLFLLLFPPFVSLLSCLFVVIFCVFRIFFFSPDSFVLN